MTNDEQDAICKAIAVSCMWGQGGIASVILERMDDAVPMERSWRSVYRAVRKQATRESVGVISDEEELKRYLNPFSNPHAYFNAGRYWLTNFDEDGCSLFNPPPMNGLSKYVSKELADKYRPRYDTMSTRTAAD